MAAHRMAARRSRTHQILAIHHACRDPSGGTRAYGQTTLDHRAGLSGVETGTRSGSLRRAWMEGFSSPRHLMHRGLWVPGGRTESFFPLGPDRQSWTTSPRTAGELPAPRIASVRSAIIRNRLPRCVYELQDFWLRPCPAVLAVLLFAYN